MPQRRILVIEDDASFASALGELIRRCGHVPLSAGRGDTGLVIARDARPDAIVLDLRLPGIDGWVLLDRLEHDAATSTIPVCVLTGDSRRLRAMRLGAFAFLQKPVANELFASTLREIDDYLARPHKRVLLVDDDPLSRERTMAALANDAVDVSAVALADSKRAFEAGPYDCGVLGTRDVADLESTLVSAFAHALPPRGVPLFVRTRREADRDRVRDLQRAAYEAVVKPWTTEDDLSAQVMHALHIAPGAVGRGGRHGIDSALAGRRVLLIDDDARNVLALTGWLERNGIEVVSARSGAEALSALRTKPSVDLVLTDIMMPEMDGFETIRAIRAMPSYRAVPIVAVTAKAMKGDREACLHAGATDFVAKPVDVEQLCSVMRVLLAD
jgi:CheY-like chemotaxis protein